MDAILVRYNGNAWLFKHVENANTFMESRTGSIAKRVDSCLYYMQFADAIPNYQ